MSVDEVTESPSITMLLVSFHFVVHGKVQHVSMRAYTKKQADKLGINGWVKNTADGTVEGDASGTVEACAKFKRWLQTRGSPRAVITKAEFTEERHIGTDTETHVDDAMHVT
eukprot:m.714197 g.714197  ORF g.714197 m.714197 type:complete len:112 (-) comp22971_c1_seq88:713-1048(-)